MEGAQNRDSEFDISKNEPAAIEQFAEWVAERRQHPYVEDAWNTARSECPTEQTGDSSVDNINNMHTTILNYSTDIRPLTLSLPNLCLKF
jgi:hypothetical protein